VLGDEIEARRSLTRGRLCFASTTLPDYAAWQSIAAVLGTLPVLTTAAIPTRVFIHRTRKFAKNHTHKNWHAMLSRGLPFHIRAMMAWFDG